MTEPARDRWGRPLIQPPGGGEAAPYTRASTLAKTLDDTSALTAWKGRMTAVGLARSPHLLDRVGSLVNKHERPVDEAKRDLNGIVRDATQAAGASDAATVGTTLHELTEVLDSGRELTIVPEHWRGHLDAYLAATAGLEMLEIETFVVRDDFQAAGTFDRLVRMPDGRVVVADIKTGKSDPHFPLAVATQIAIYALGLRYNPENGERNSIHPDLDNTTGLLIHLPAKSSPPMCNLYELNLDIGDTCADLATKVRDLRGFKAETIAVPRIAAAGVSA